MKYTMSRDGVERANIHVKPVRLTKEEFLRYDEMAKAVGYDNLRDYLQDSLTSALYFKLSDDYDNLI